MVVVVVSEQSSEEEKYILFENKHGFIFGVIIPSLAAKRRPSEGANIDLRLVAYDAKCKRIQSRIEFIPSLGVKRSKKRSPIDVIGGLVPSHRGDATP